MANRPPRMPGFPYKGLHRYFVTANTYKHQRAFADAGFAAIAQAHLLRRAPLAGFNVAAYCLMPDHVHLLVHAVDSSADFMAFWRAWRQQTGLAWRRLRGQKLWMEGFFDRVLREEETSLGVAAYIVFNPVRAGLVVSPMDYPWSRCQEFTFRELAEAAQMPIRVERRPRLKPRPNGQG